MRESDNDKNRVWFGLDWGSNETFEMYYDNFVVDTSQIGVYPWGTAVTLDSNAGNEYPTISLDTATNDLYALWIRSSHIYYKKATYSAGPTWTWDVGATDWKTTTSGVYLTSNYSGNGMIFAEWTSGSGAPYSVNWDYIIIPENLWPVLAIGLTGMGWARRKKQLIETNKTNKNE